MIPICTDTSADCLVQWATTGAFILFLVYIAALFTGVTRRGRQGIDILAALTSEARVIAENIRGSRESQRTRADLLSRTSADTDAVSKDRHDLFMAIDELRNGLNGFADQISSRQDGGNVSHIRITDVFSARLPGQFVARPRAVAVSRHLVQVGLLSSVFFIFLSLLILGDAATDMRALITTVAGKFAFTVLGLLGSLLVLGVSEARVREAQRAMVKLEYQLEERLELPVLTATSGAFQLLEMQAETNRQLATLLDNLKTAVASLSASATRLDEASTAAQGAMEAASQAVGTAGTTASETIGTARDSAQSALNGVENAVNRLMETLTESVAKVSTGLTADVQRELKDFTEAMAKVRGELQSTATEVSKAMEGRLASAGTSLQSALETAGLEFDQRIRATAGTFDGAVATAGGAFGSTVSGSADNFREKMGEAGRTFGETVNNAGTHFRGETAEGLKDLRNALAGVREQLTLVLEKDWAVAEKSEESDASVGQSSRES